MCGSCGEMRNVWVENWLHNSSSSISEIEMFGVGWLVLVWFGFVGNQKQFIAPFIMLLCCESCNAAGMQIWIKTNEVQFYKGIDGESHFFAFANHPLKRLSIWWVPIRAGREMAWVEWLNAVRKSNLPLRSRIWPQKWKIWMLCYIDDLASATGNVSYHQACGGLQSNAYILTCQSFFDGVWFIYSSVPTRWEDWRKKRKSYQLLVKWESGDSHRGMMLREKVCSD